MKRYEIMSKEDIIDAFEKFDHVIEIKRVIEHLDEEIELVSRWQNIKTDEDLHNTISDFNCVCRSNDCISCQWWDADNNQLFCCLERYMMQQVERK